MTNIQPEHSWMDRPAVEQVFKQAKCLRGSFLRQQPASMLGMAAWLGLIGMFATVLILESNTTRQRTLEATSQMERLAKMLSQARTIAPATAREIDQLIQRPHYLCTPSACDAALDNRNRIARVNLKMLLGSLPSVETAAATASTTGLARPSE